MRFAYQFFARMVFGTSYSGDFTEYTYTQTNDKIHSNIFYQTRGGRGFFFKVYLSVMKTQTAFRNETGPRSAIGRASDS